MGFITDPLLQILIFLYGMLGNSLGLAILAFTILLRTALIPLTIPTIKSQKKMRALKPEIDKLKQKHAGDKAKLQQAQMELYKQHNLNPLGGCLPNILQFVVLIALYQVLNNILHTDQINGADLDTMFLGFDLAVPDRSFVLPVLAGVTQLILSLMILPGAEKHDLIPNDAKSKKLQDANKKEQDTLEMAETMQRQMVFMFPIITVIAGLQFPAGLAMYWVATTVFSIVQQLALSGPGGLSTYIHKILPKKESR